MGEKKKWDLTSTHSLEGAAEWLRKGSGAEVVFVIRKGDLAVGVNPSLLPQEVCGLVNESMAALYRMMLERKGRDERPGEDRR